MSVAHRDPVPWVECGAVNDGSHDAGRNGQPCKRRATANGRCSKHPLGAVEVLPLGEGRSCMTAEQREEFVRLVDSGRGHVAAARRVGVPGTKGEVGALLAADDEVQDALAEAAVARLERSGLGVGDLLVYLGRMAAKENGRSQFRATTYGLGLHGISVREVQQVEHTGADGGAIVVEHERRLTLGDLAEFVQSRNGSGFGDGGGVPVAGAVLPELGDGESAAG